MKYTTPETKSLKVNAQFALCEGSPTPVPQRSGNLGTMNVKNVNSWN